MPFLCLKINYYYRFFFGHILHFLLYFYGFVSQLFYFPIIDLGWKNKSKKERHLRAQRYVYRIFRFYVYSLKFFGIIDIKVHNPQGLLNAKGHMIISNHPSFLDAVILIAHTPQADCIVKAGVFDNILLGAVMRKAGYIKNTGQPESLIRECHLRIKEGRNVIIFPEGTRTASGKKMRFQRGFMNVVDQASLLMQYVHITVFPFTLQKENKWYNVPYKKPCFTLYIDEAKPFLQNESEKTPRAIWVRQKTREVEDVFRACYMENIKQDIKSLIIHTLKLKDITADDIEDDLSLFSEKGLGLSPMDVLELKNILQKRYNLPTSIKTDEKTQEAFKTVTSLAHFITDYKNIYDI